MFRLHSSLQGEGNPRIGKIRPECSSAAEESEASKRFRAGSAFAAGSTGKVSQNLAVVKLAGPFGC
jgi:hypothetical protein